MRTAVARGPSVVLKPRRWTGSRRGTGLHASARGPSPQGAIRPVRRPPLDGNAAPDLGWRSVRRTLSAREETVVCAVPSAPGRRDTSEYGRLCQVAPRPTAAVTPCTVHAGYAPGFGQCRPAQCRGDRNVAISLKPVDGGASQGAFHKGDRPLQGGSPRPQQHHG